MQTSRLHFGPNQRSNRTNQKENYFDGAAQPTKNASKLPMLMYMMHDLKFHGKYLKAELAHFRFNYMEEYTPIISACPECKEYGHWLRVRERELKEMAIQCEIERINNAHVMKRRVMVMEEKKVLQ